MIQRFLTNIKGNRLFWFVICYLLFYITVYFWLENRTVELHMVRSPFDQYIPFCEYFIVPYFLWFVYIAITVIYFTCYCENRMESWKFVLSFCSGMSVFLLVSYFYPNGHSLRPELEGTGFFFSCIRFLYKVDTSTNVLPSMHVYVTVANSIALLRQKNLRRHKGFAPVVYAIGTLIVLSTLFLKQHSLVDVIGAFVLNVVTYWIIYKINWRGTGLVSLLTAKHREK